MHYNFIAVEGNIGSGKTTLAKQLAKDYKARLILESFADNPFLPKFYKNPKQDVFALELFFMAERYSQLKKELEKSLFQSLTISDYSFIKSKLFAQNNLQNDELELFKRLYDIMFASLPKPELVVYLYANIERLQKNIKKRARDFEQNISDKYLQDIQNKYLDYLRKQNNFPVLIVDVSAIDFLKDQSVYQQIKKAIVKKYSKDETYYLEL